MDWKEYRVEPEEGMFEKIQRRVRVRRAWRMGGAAAVVVAVAAAGLLLAPWNTVEDKDAETPSAASVEVAALAQQPSAGDQSVADAVAAVPTEAKATAAKTVDMDDLLPQAGQIDLAEIAVPQEGLPMDEQLYRAVDALPPTSDRGSVAKTEPGDVETVVADNDPSEQQATQGTAPKSGEPQPEPYHEDNLLWVPNIIVPGGERDENRTFRIITSSPISEFVIHIYNRGGRLIYSSTDPAFAWDAVYNGRPVPQGAYVYVATFRDTDGNPRQQTGTVTVVR